LVQVLLYGDVVYASSCSLVLVSRYERVATVGDFYTEDANARCWGVFENPDKILEHVRENSEHVQAQ
jgi:hypothetical protein